MRFYLLLLISFFIVQSTSANWIIISQRYTADPCVILYNGRVYVYTSEDRDACLPVMGRYNCFSSDDLLNWTDHGFVLTPDDIPYSDMFWAPEAVYHNNKFYLYFCEPMKGTGVVESNSPIGPWTDMRDDWLLTGHKVDVGILFDDDGTPWGYWPAGYVRKFKQNMYELEPEEYGVWGGDAYENPYVKKINGKYYFMYQSFSATELWSCPSDGQPNDCPVSGDAYFHRYHYLDAPDGNVIEPASVHGRTMMWPVTTSNTAPAIFQYEGIWYGLYHSITLSNSIDGCNFHRNIGLDRIYFDENGDFIPQTTTESGLKQARYLNPYKRQEAETIGRESGIEVVPTSDEGIYGEHKVDSLHHNDWIKIFGVDFGAGATSFEARVASLSGGGQIEIRLDSVNGNLAGIVDIPATGGGEIWQTVNISVSGTSGVHDLFFVFKNGGFGFNWWQFSGGTVYGAIPEPVVKTISIKSKSENKYITASSISLNPTASTIAVDQQYYLYDNENGTYSIYSVGQGKYIEITGNKLTATQNNRHEAEKFILQRNPFENYCLFSQTDQSYVIYSSTENALVTGAAEAWKEPYRSVSQFKISYLNIPVPVCNIPQSPYLANTIPGTLEAENYDEGCPGEAYHDLDILNTTGYGRQNGPDVDTIPGGLVVTNTASGEWLAYTIDVQTSGIYDAILTLKADHDNNLIKWIVDDTDTAEYITFNSTGNIYSNLNTRITLDTGKHELKLFIEKGNFNLDKISFSLNTACSISSVQIIPVGELLSTNDSVKINAVSYPLGTLDYRILSGPATLTNDTIVLTGWKGKVTYEALFPGDANTCPSRAKDSFNIIHDCTPQFITFDSIPDKLASDTSFQLYVSSDASLPVNLEITGPVTLNGNTLSINGTVGKVIIKATQKGNDSICEAVSIIREFNVLMPPDSCNDSKGYLNLQKWNDIPGVSVSFIPTDSIPDFTDTITSMDVSSFNEDDYGLRIHGYLCAPYTGTYTFFISGDDNVELWLSSDEDSLNSQRIAYHNDWTGLYEWTKFPTQQSDPIELIAGQKYYISALLKEGFGGDHLSVKWITPYGVNRIIGGQYLSPVCLVQNISLPATYARIDGNKFKFNVTTSSGLPAKLSFSGNNIQIQGDTVILSSNRENIILTAGQPGDSIYCSATSVSKNYLLINTNTGINQTDLNNTFTISPNPVTDYLSIIKNDTNNNPSEHYTITIRDIQGKLMFHENTSITQFKEINISEFSKGLYFIEIKNNHGIINKKIIKM